jgi:hypothetical protein
MLWAICLVLIATLFGLVLWCIVIYRQNHRPSVTLKSRESPLLFPALFGLGGVGQYGYISLTGNVVIKPSFSRAKPFSNGLAAVETAQNVGSLHKYRWGYIDSSGSFVIPPKYIEAGAFSCGLAAVKSERTHQTSYINDQGKVVWKSVVQKYPYLEIIETRPFRDGVAPCLLSEGPFNSGNKRFGLVSVQGRLIVSFKNAAGFYGGFSDGLLCVDGIGYVDISGNTRISERQFKGAGFSEGMAAVSRTRKEDGKVWEEWGYINTSATQVIAYKYKEARPFHKSLAWVRGQDGVWRIIDKIGSELSIVQTDYNPLFGFSEGRAFAVENNQYCIVDIYGSQIEIAPEIKEPFQVLTHEVFHNGLAEVFIETEKFPRKPIQVYVSKDGHLIWRSDQGTLTATMSSPE